MMNRNCRYCGQAFTPPADHPAALYCGEVCLQEAEYTQGAFGAWVVRQPISPTVMAALLAEPLLQHWARQIIWRQDATEFMVCEDYTFADLDSRQIVLTAAPIQAMRSPDPRWREVLFDYNLILLELAQVSVTQLILTNYLPLLHFFLASEHVGMRRSLAANPRLPFDLLERLAYDEHPAVRKTVVRWGRRAYEAALPNSAYLAHLEQAAITAELARFVQLLAQLAHDRETSVRLAVAQNSYTPPEVLTRLAQDGYWQVRYTVATHPDTPFIELQALTEDEHDTVRQIARLYLAQREPPR
jgi:hypothetical protein